MTSTARGNEDREGFAPGVPGLPDHGGRGADQLTLDRAAADHGVGRKQRKRDRRAGGGNAGHRSPY
jgi:hypothetical protein